MKKMFIAIVAVAFSLTLFSFRPTDKTKGEFDIINNLTSIELGEAASFTSSYKKGTDALTTWEEYHKYWTLTSAESEQELEAVLSDY